MWDVLRYPSNEKISVHELPCTKGHSSTTEIQQTEPTWSGWIGKGLMKEVMHEVMERKGRYYSKFSFICLIFNLRTFSILVDLQSSVNFYCVAKWFSLHIYTSFFMFFPTTLETRETNSFKPKQSFNFIFSMSSNVTQQRMRQRTRNSRSWNDVARRPPLV